MYGSNKFFRALNPFIYPLMLAILVLILKNTIADYVPVSAIKDLPSCELLPCTYTFKLPVVTRVSNLHLLYKSKFSNIALDEFDGVFRPTTGA